MLTYVGSYDEGLALGAVRRELLREGQVFWVHNRVATIDRQAAWIQEQLPEARVAIAHGQMDEDQLERQMMRFWDREADILVCSTIIESGLDVPNANTLIVDRADLLGLAQMYQLRGRVGRSTERAFAYLFFPPVRELTDEARERLATIGKHQALGSGFRIALRDLEIRGAGNLLGGEQSGHIAAVGFDAYARILQESMAEMKGEEIPEEKELRIDLPVKAFVPPGWVAQEALRLELYRRISLAASHEVARADPLRDRRPLRRAAGSGRDALRGGVAARDLPCARRGGDLHVSRSGRIKPVAIPEALQADLEDRIWKGIVPRHDADPEPRAREGLRDRPRALRRAEPRGGGHERDLARGRGGGRRGPGRHAGAGLRGLSGARRGRTDAGPVDWSLVHPSPIRLIALSVVAVLALSRLCRLARRAVGGRGRERVRHHRRAAPAGGGPVSVPRRDQPVAVRAAGVG